MEGIALAKKRGDYKGRKKALTPKQIHALQQRANNGERKSQSARDFHISRETLYQYLKVTTQTILRSFLTNHN